VQQADGVLTDNTGGQAKIVGQDIEASNGMIQVINAVLLPGDCELRMLDHSVRLILLIGRFTRWLRRLDPRLNFPRRSPQP
jgi:hypothetical protein